MLKEEKETNGETGLRKIPFLKLYTVFNASQIDGLSEGFTKIPEKPMAHTEERIDAIENFFHATQAKITTGVNAAYNSITDHIEMPPFACFHSAEEYYATLAHEVTHWTKHPNRLNRDFNCKARGDEGYAKEELVAELGACFLGADLGFEPVTKKEHAAYIQSWLQVLKNEKRFIFQAAAQAQKAVEYLGSFQTVKKAEKNSVPVI